MVVLYSWYSCTCGTRSTPVLVVLSYLWYSWYSWYSRYSCTRGTCCTHVLVVLVVLQSPVWSSPSKSMLGRKPNMRHLRVPKPTQTLHPLHPSFVPQILASFPCVTKIGCSKTHPLPPFPCVVPSIKGIINLIYIKIDPYATTKTKNTPTVSQFCAQTYVLKCDRIGSQIHSGTVEHAQPGIHTRYFPV